MPHAAFNRKPMTKSRPCVRQVAAHSRARRRTCRRASARRAAMSAAIQYARPWNQRGSVSAKTRPTGPPRRDRDQGGHAKGLVGFMSKGGTGISPRGASPKNKIWWKTGTASAPAMKASTRMRRYLRPPSTERRCAHGFFPHTRTGQYLAPLLLPPKSTRRCRPSAAGRHARITVTSADVGRRSPLLGFGSPPPEICTLSTTSLIPAQQWP